MWITLKEFFCFTSRLNPALEILQAFSVLFNFQGPIPRLFGGFAQPAVRGGAYLV